MVSYIHTHTNHERVRASSNVSNENTSNHIFSKEFNNYHMPMNRKYKSMYWRLSSNYVLSIWFHWISIWNNDSRLLDQHTHDRTFSLFLIASNSSAWFSFKSSAFSAPIFQFYARLNFKKPTAGNCCTCISISIKLDVIYCTYILLSKGISLCIVYMRCAYNVSRKMTYFFSIMNLINDYLEL